MKADDKNSGLRKKAEDQIKASNKKAKKISTLEQEHELHVHRIELQMQNEELNTIQQDLARSLENYSDLFENAPFIYFILDSRGVILNVNQIGVDQFKFQNKEAMVGKNIAIFIANAEHQDSFYLHFNSVLETKKLQHMECDFKQNLGKSFNGMLESRPLFDAHDKLKHVLCAVQDITMLKEQGRKLELSLMKEKELNELKSQFITIASHEFRTPLTTILSSSELIEQYNSENDFDKRKKHLRKITTAVNRLKEILMDFVSIEKISQGKTKNRPENFNISDFMKNTLDELSSFNGIHLVNYIHIGKNEVVCLDQKLLKTSIMNLIINAYKYSPKGGEVDVKTVLKKNELSISISDQGIGIPAKDQSHIFEPFFRAKNVSDFQGTGLGLNITRESIQLMGGTISFTSVENEGTTFYLLFPLK